MRGYPVAYFIQQMHDFRDGNRESADPKKANTKAMATMAKAMTEEEIKAAAEYFGSMKWSQWIRVVETDSVPKTRRPCARSGRRPLGLLKMLDDVTRIASTTTHIGTARVVRPLEDHQRLAACGEIVPDRTGCGPPPVSGW